MIGDPTIRLDTVDSTNAYAAARLAAGEWGHGTVVAARQQTGGRGQRGRRWHTATGLDLAASMVLIPERMPATAQFTLAKAAALAVRDTVAEALRLAGKDSAAVRVKWPNDVFVERRKVAGILITNEIRGAELRSSITGIGINVNSVDLPDDLQATSIAIATGKLHELDEVLLALCRNMEHWWGRITTDGAAIDTAYDSALWAKERFTGFLLDGRPVTARPLGVDEAGRLIVEDTDGSVAAYGLERLRAVR